MTSKYDRLADYLFAIGEPEITLTFAEVEIFIGPLPTVARHDLDWWGTAASGRYYFAHARHWERAGYLPDCPDLAAETITFRRIVP